MTTSDDDLLATLAVALAPAPVSPGADEIAALRALVTGRDDADVVAFVPVRRPSHPARRMLTAAAAVIALVVAVGAFALATGSRLPGELRAPARALGLPVDSAALADARSAMSTLRDALDHADNAHVTVARDALVARLHRLGSSDRAAIENEAKALVARADARVRGVEIGDATGTTRSPPTSTTTEPPAGAAPSPDTASGTGAAEGSTYDVSPTTPAAGEADPPTTVTAEPGDTHDTLGLDE